MPDCSGWHVIIWILISEAILCLPLDFLCKLTCSICCFHNSQLNWSCLKIHHEHIITYQFHLHRFNYCSLFLPSCCYSTHITLDKCLKSGFEMHSYEMLQTSSPTWSTHRHFLLWESLLWLFLSLLAVLSACCMLSFAQESKGIPLKNLLSLCRTPALLLWALVMRASDRQLIKNSPQVKQTIKVTCGHKNIWIHNSVVSHS